MKIRANINVILDVPKDLAERILEGNVSDFLSTMYNGNCVQSPEFGKWWVDGEYTVGKRACNVDAISPMDAFD